MTLNRLGFLSASLYLFEGSPAGKATEHLIGPGIKPEHLNDDRLGRVVDKHFKSDLTELFVGVADSSKEALVEAMTQALAIVSVEDVRGFFVDCGYRPWRSHCEKRSEMRAFFSTQ